MAASDLDLRGEPFLSLGGEGSAAATALADCTTTFQDLQLGSGTPDVQGPALAPVEVDVDAMQALELAIEADRPKCVVARAVVHSECLLSRLLTQGGTCPARRFEPSAEWQHMLQAVQEEATGSGPLMLAGPGAEEDPALKPSEGVGRVGAAVQPHGEPGGADPSAERGVDAGVDAVMG